MANNNKRKNRYLVLQRIVTALLTVSLTLLVALGIYAFSTWFTDYTESKTA